ncbi:Sodium-driven chloride bicarbonate exchanger [Liparis tanakae]|uniref:Sodium-driven chloride bicarbonate exchanger n=1 Tax=Liparis tanakae TaxID=230148 RepID=A0A4Z2GBL8_9TELE|nr:Sodium-driven chloride bicarbonate exchanger [Liparis tanakae]
MFHRGRVGNVLSIPLYVLTCEEIDNKATLTNLSPQIFHDVAYKAKDRNDLVAGIDEFLDQVTVLPPGEWDPSIRIEPPKNVPSQEKRKIPPLPNGVTDLGESEDHGGHGGPELQRTGRLFGGLFMDIKRKAPHYVSDFTDAISLQCLASFLFLYCACMSPVITFGGLLGEATEGRVVSCSRDRIVLHPQRNSSETLCSSVLKLLFHKFTVKASTRCVVFNLLTAPLS